MNLMQLFRSANQSNKEGSASVAKERLQILVAHERISRASHEFLPAMQKDILEVVQKYIEVAQEHINIRLDNEGDCSILEVNVQLPEGEQTSPPS
ncbi:cell division topological specificity factor MinE [Candidatus Sororendozoicomonas aggregata]|uniref:cell division topological specificity factor MinE n=1 Tax=Candidatus Sororendozoicomonas aggregata TaxID=3073239 RepID=UPI003B75C9EF